MNSENFDLSPEVIITPALSVFQGPVANVMATIRPKRVGAVPLNVEIDVSSPLGYGAAVDIKFNPVISGKDKGDRHYAITGMYLSYVPQSRKFTIVATCIETNALNFNKHFELKQAFTVGDKNQPPAQVHRTHKTVPAPMRELKTGLPAEIMADFAGLVITSATMQRIDLGEYPAGTVTPPVNARRVPSSIYTLDTTNNGDSNRVPYAYSTGVLRAPLELFLNHKMFGFAKPSVQLHPKMGLVSSDDKVRQKNMALFNRVSEALRDGEGPSLTRLVEAVSAGLAKIFGKIEKGGEFAGFLEACGTFRAKEVEKGRAYDALVDQLGVPSDTAVAYAAVKKYLGGATPARKL